GFDDAGSPILSAELYDPISGAWSATGSMPGSAIASARLPDGRVLVVGGQGTNGAPPLAAIYEPNTGTWTSTNSPATVHPGQATLLRNGKVLIAGGTDIFFEPVATAQLYDPASGQWSPTGPLNFARRGHRATLLPDGKVLITGGTGAAGSMLCNSELYDPASGTWTVAASLNVARDSHTATLLANQTVLIAGGVNDFFAPIRTTELYQSAAATWKTSGAMNKPRTAREAVLLANGQVLVACGFNGAVLADAERYNPVTGSWTPSGSAGVARS